MLKIASMENRTSNLSVSPKRRAGGKYFRIFMIVLFLFLAVFIYWRYFFTYSNGNRYGLLQKFSHKGNLFKTYEGEMILSSVRSNNNVPLASEKFFFSVTNKNVASQLMNVQGKFLTVHYKEKKGTLSFRGDSKYIVDSIKVEDP